MALHGNLGESKRVGARQGAGTNNRIRTSATCLGAGAKDNTLSLFNRSRQKHIIQSDRRRGGVVTQAGMGGASQENGNTPQLSKLLARDQRQAPTLTRWVRPPSTRSSCVSVSRMSLKVGLRCGQRSVGRGVWVEECGQRVGHWVEGAERGLGQKSIGSLRGCM